MSASMLATLLIARRHSTASGATKDLPDGAKAVVELGNGGVRERRNEFWQMEGDEKAASPVPWYNIYLKLERSVGLQFT